MNGSRFGGVFSLLLTPFLPDGRVDWQTYERYVAWQMQFKPDGLFAVCGSSEMKWLALEERLRLAKAAASIAGKTPVVATANLEPEIARHDREIQEMAATGVAGVVLVPPPGMGESQDRLGEYFGQLIDRAPCPALIYEWPMVRPYLIEARIYADLVRLHKVAGIKDTTCTMEGITAKIAVRGDSTVFQANAPFLSDSIRAGAGGIMAITTTAAADVAIEYWQEERRLGTSGLSAGGLADARAEGRADGSADTVALPASGPADKAAALHELLVLLDCALIRGDAYPASAKHLATLRGFPMDTACRNPVRLVPEVRKAVAVWLDALNRHRSLK